MRETTPDLTKISKYISLILRHKPEVIGIQLDAHGCRLQRLHDRTDL